MNIDYKYDAFISYRHSEPDQTIARKLALILETFKAPKNVANSFGSTKLKRIFRDRDELPTSPFLDDNIKEALTLSRFLIVICSPRTPLSAWCREEIRFFRETHGNEQILALLIEGEPSESFPYELNHVQTTLIKPDKNGMESEEKVTKIIEPVAADIRPPELKGVFGEERIIAYSGSKQKLSSTDNKYLKKSLKLLKSEQLRLLAPLFNYSYDELYRRHHRRMIKNMIVGSVSTLLVISLAAAAFGMQWKEVQYQKQIAAQEKAENILKLAEREKEQGNVLQALMLGVEAVNHLKVEEGGEPVILQSEFLFNSILNDSESYCPNLTLWHKGKVLEAEFDQDGSKIMTIAKAVGTKSKSVSIWDTVTGKLLFENDGNITDAALSIDGSKVLIFNEDTTTLYNVKTNKPVNILSPEKPLICAEFNYTNEYIAGFSFPNTVLVADAISGQIMHQYTLKSNLYYFKTVLSPTENKVFILGQDGTANILDFDNNTVLPMEIPGTSSDSHVFYRPEFSKDGRKVLCIDSSYNQILIWDSTTGGLIKCLPADQNDSSELIYASFDVTGQRIVSCSTGGSAVVYDLINDTSINLSGHFLSVNSAVFSKDSRYVLTAGEDGYAALFQAQDGKMLARLGHHSRALSGAIFSPQDDFIATFSDDGSVVLWKSKLVNLPDGGGKITMVYYSEDGTQAGVVNNLGMTLFYDLQKHTLVDKKQDINRPSGFYEGLSKEVTSSAEEDIDVQFAGDGSVRIRNAKGSMYLEGHSQWVSDILFDPGRDKVLTCSKDNTAILWDYGSGQKLRVFSGHNSGVKTGFFSRDNNYLVTVDEEGKALLWELCSSKELEGMATKVISNRGFTKKETEIYSVSAE